MTDKSVKAVDLRFIDFPGMSQHFTIPVSALNEASFEEGVGFDGSSIRGWQVINESDMLVFPVADTAFLDPFAQAPTLALLWDIKDLYDLEDHEMEKVPQTPRIRRALLHSADAVGSNCATLHLKNITAFEHTIRLTARFHRLKLIPAVSPCRSILTVVLVAISRLLQEQVVFAWLNRFFVGRLSPIRHVPDTRPSSPSKAAFCCQPAS